MSRVTVTIKGKPEGGNLRVTVAERGRRKATIKIIDSGYYEHVSGDELSEAGWIEMILALDKVHKGVANHAREARRLQRRFEALG